MKLNKLTTILTVFLALSVLFSGCSQPSPAPTEKPTDPVETKEPIDTKEPVKTEEPVETEEPVITEEPLETEEPQETLPPVEPIEPGGPPNYIEPEHELTLYNWSEYIDPEVYSLFEQEFGIRVIEENFSNNEEMLAKIQDGATGYALIVPSDYTVGIMVEEAMLAELDQDRIPNMTNLAKRFQDPPYDPGNRHCVPYQWGTTGLGYIEGEVDAPTSWAVLFEPDPESPSFGRATMLDNPRESFASALAYLGYDINSSDEAQLQEAKDLLVKAKIGLAGYDSETFADLLASRENLLAHGWNGDFLAAQEVNENIAFIVPQEGGAIWVDAICIPNTVSQEQKAAAEMFINFILRPDIAAMISEYNGYASPNEAAEAFLDEEFLSNPAVYPPSEVLQRLQFLRPVGEAESLYQRLWDEIKSALQ